MNDPYTWAGQLEFPKQAYSKNQNKLKLHFVFEITITHLIWWYFKLFILKFFYFSFEFLDLEKQKFHKQTYLFIETLITLEVAIWIYSSIFRFLK